MQLILQQRLLHFALAGDGLLPAVEADDAARRVGFEGGEIRRSRHSEKAVRNSSPTNGPKTCCATHYPTRPLVLVTGPAAETARTFSGVGALSHLGRKKRGT
jgi:hypothetical protein